MVDVPDQNPSNEPEKVDNPGMKPLGGLAVFWHKVGEHFSHLTAGTTGLMNFLSQILVPIILMFLIIIFSYVLLLTWPITHENGKAVCDQWNAQKEERHAIEPNLIVSAQWVIQDSVMSLVAFCQEEEADNWAHSVALRNQENRPVITKSQETVQPDPGSSSTPDTDENEPASPVPYETRQPGNPNKKSPEEQLEEVRQGNALFLAVLAAGIIGGSVYSLRAHTKHVAQGDYDPKWWQWNIARPFLSGALAVLFFFLVRAGFVQDGNTEALKPEGFIAIAALVGLFTDEAWAKIQSIAQAMFKDKPGGV